jgi:hypothetical protein
MSKRLRKGGLLGLAGGLVLAMVTPVSSVEAGTKLLLLLVPPADVTRAPGETIGPMDFSVIHLSDGGVVVDLESRLLDPDGRTLLSFDLIQGLAIARERDQRLGFVTEIPDWMPHGDYQYMLTVRAHRTGEVLANRSFAFRVAPAELCDGVDNDHNGLVDEGFDRDADGFVACSLGQVAADCDDHDSKVNPGAIEVCGDSLDNDCDEFTDETACSVALRDATTR